MRLRLTFRLVSAISAATLTAACGGSTAITEITGPGDVRCQTGVSALPSSFPAAGNRVTLTVNAARECTWSASSEAPWVQVSPASGQGEASITLMVAANPEGRSRTGAVVVNDNRLSLTQDAAPCQFEVSPGTLRLSHDGGRATFRLSATEACEWRATSSQSWVRVLNSTGSSSATVELEVSQNDSGALRTASVAVADRNVTIAQEPAVAPAPAPPPNPGPNPNPPNPNPNPNPAPPCVPTLDSSERAFNPAGGDGSFRVTIAAGCRWSASSDASWVSITGSNDGTGSDTVRYRVDANANPSTRNATISVAGQTHRVRQDGAPAVPPGNGNGERVDLSGRAFFVDGSCPNLTFFLESRRVFTTDDTNFRGNCRAIRNRTRLAVDGRLQPDGRVRATRVDIGGDDDDDDN